jgi:hypothetical protein
MSSSSRIELRLMSLLTGTPVRAAIAEVLSPASTT